MHIRPIKTRVFREGEDLVSFITKHIPRAKEKTVIVVTSKIAALAENRTSPLLSRKDEAKLIRSESTLAIETEHVWLTMKDGIFIANAGIDKSNADGKLILLPLDSFASAENIRKALMRIYKVKQLGVLLTDSRVVPLRAGVTGVALGYAGFKGVFDYRKKKDIFGRPFVFEQTNVADNLASASILVMGEGSERQPLAVIEDAPIAFQNRIDKNEAAIPLKDDLYFPVLKGLVKKKKTRGR